MRYLSPVTSVKDIVWSLFIGLICGVCAFLLLPLGQMISVQFMPRVTVQNQTLGTEPPVVIEPPKPPEPDVKKPEIKPLEKTFKPPSIGMLEASMNLNLSGMAGGGVYVDTGMVQQELEEEILRISDLTVRPKVLRQTSPVYPVDYERRGIEGEVTVEFVVRSDGKTSRIRVIKASSSGFIDPSIEAVKRWLFVPGEKDGKAVHTWVRIVIPYSLKE